MKQSAQNLRVTGSRLLVEILPNEDKGIGRLLLPETFSNPQLKGIVRGVGRDCKEFPGSVGDIVMFDRYSGNEHKNYPGVIIIHEKNILGVLTS